MINGLFYHAGSTALSVRPKPELAKRIDAKVASADRVFLKALFT